MECGLAGTGACRSAHEGRIAKGVTGTIAACAGHTGVGQCPLSPNGAEHRADRRAQDHFQHAATTVGLAERLGKGIEALSCHGGAPSMIDPTHTREADAH
jgi:hypothetical protein